MASWARVGVNRGVCVLPAGRWAGQSWSLLFLNDSPDRVAQGLLHARVLFYVLQVLQVDSFLGASGVSRSPHRQARTSRLRTNCVTAIVCAGSPSTPGRKPAIGHRGIQPPRPIQVQVLGQDTQTFAAPGAHRHAGGDGTVEGFPQHPLDVDRPALVLHRRISGARRALRPYLAVIAHGMTMLLDMGAKSTH